jgi:tetratricopeptide (TPR) repeat protein
MALQNNPPATVDRRLNQVTQLIAESKLNEAEALCQKLAPQLKKNDPYLLHSLGLINFLRHNYPEAVELFELSVTTITDNPNFYSNLGEALRRIGKSQEALLHFHNALLVDPYFPKAHLGIANTLSDLNRSEHAVVRFQFLIKLHPDFAPAYHYLGAMFTKLERNQEAVPLIRKALALQKDYYEAKFSLANAFEQDGKSEEAMQIYEELLVERPHDAAVHNNYANLLRSVGQSDKAEAHLKKAIEHNPRHLSAYFNRSGKALGKDLTEADVQRLEAWLADPNLKNEDESGIHFTLAKYFDAHKNYEKAFYHFHTGNEIDRRKEPYDAQSHEHATKVLSKFFNSSFFARHTHFGCESELPVFIFGMPRSGTTLVEQIIASHPQAYGAGELRFISETVQKLAAKMSAQGGYPQFLNHLNPIDACMFGEEYVRRLQGMVREDSKGVLRITDKMPGNFQFLGMIALLLPKAKLIHCRRDPMDSCFSCFTQRFTQVILFSRKLSDLGHYYQNYERLMAHWHRELPLQILDVQYEDMVEDSEAMSRKIIDFIGLEWDDACLNFHQTKRQVKTASVEQIRQPIYTSSVGKWRKYQPFLSPLVEALGEYAPRDL